MSTLARSSLVSVVAEALIVLIVVIRAPSAAAEMNTTAEFTFGKVHGSFLLNYNFLGKATVFSGIGTMTFSFVCQHSTFIVFNTMRDRTLSSWKTVSTYSMWTSGIISMAMAVAGYLAFFEDTQANILKSFPEVYTSFYNF